MIGKKKIEKEMNPNIGVNHFNVLVRAMKKLNDPTLDYREIPVSHGVGLRKSTSIRHEKISDDEKIKGANYLIPIFNRLIDEMLKLDE